MGQTYTFRVMSQPSGTSVKLVKTMVRALRGPKPNIWLPLVRAAQSPASDSDAVETVRPVVRGARRDAKITLSRVRAASAWDGGYLADRMVRLLEAAIAERPVAAISPGRAELFERERRLGWMPLGDAFDELAAAVPQLQEVRARAEHLASSPEAVVAQEDGRVIVSGRLITEAVGDAQHLVGPDSGHPDPLIRSRLAQQIVFRYADAVLAAPVVDSTRYSIWDHNAPKVGARWSHTSSFGEPHPQ